MIKGSASQAKTQFGALSVQTQREPVLIKKQGRSIAVILSHSAYMERENPIPLRNEKEQALQFLEKWAPRLPVLL